VVGPIDKQVAECVGLWLAEGDNKTEAEITFTNNSLKLVKYFYRNIKNLFNADNFRLYAYYPSRDHPLKLGFKVKTIKFYVDKRANKPYFIIRIASKDIVRKWKKLVQVVESDKTSHNYILRGFFAGEGNIKTGKHFNRTLRISQRNRILIIDNILNNLGVNFTFSRRERAYVITGRSNWEKLAKIGVADLNPIKKEKFWGTYNSFVEWHYPRHYIKSNILSYIETPKTSSQLSIEFKRGRSQIQHILKKLKSEGKVKNFRVGSIDYWVKTESNTILISRRKKEILDFLSNPRKTSDVSYKMKICWKAAYRRLKELERLNLVSNKNYLWYKIPTSKEVKII